MSQRKCTHKPDRSNIIIVLILWNTFIANAHANHSICDHWRRPYAISISVSRKKKSNCNSANGDGETIKRKEPVTDLHTKRINETKINKIGFSSAFVDDWLIVDDQWIHTYILQLLQIRGVRVGAVLQLPSIICVFSLILLAKQGITSKSRFFVRQIAFNVQFYQFPTKFFWKVIQLCASTKYIWSNCIEWEIRITYEFHVYFERGNPLIGREIRLAFHF